MTQGRSWHRLYRQSHRAPSAEGSPPIMRNKPLHRSYLYIGCNDSQSLNHRQLLCIILTSQSESAAEWGRWSGVLCECWRYTVAGRCESWTVLVSRRFFASFSLSFTLKSFVVYNFVKGKTDAPEFCKPRGVIIKYFDHCVYSNTWSGGVSGVVMLSLSKEQQSWRWLDLFWITLHCFLPLVNESRTTSTSPSVLLVM